jgi:hypothetical protein
MFLCDGQNAKGICGTAVDPGVAAFAVRDHQRLCDSSLWRPFAASKYFVDMFGQHVHERHASCIHASKQTDYILGANPRGMSYMVRLENSFPQSVHHWAASIPIDGVHYSCGEGFKCFQTSDPNPNVLEGAIVGGPDQAGNYQDARMNFKQSEASTYNVAPFLGLVARLSRLSAPSTKTPAPSATKQLPPIATPAATASGATSEPISCDYSCEHC